MENINYLELAKDYFFELQEEVLDKDRHAMGVSEEKDFDIDGNKFTIAVDGFWEKSTWFDWTVYDEKRNVIASGTYS